MDIAAQQLDRLLAPFMGCFTPESAAKIAALKADEETQQRVDYLADRATEGLLTLDEQQEYSRYVSAIDVISVLQARARSVVRQSS